MKHKLLSKKYIGRGFLFGLLGSVFVVPLFLILILNSSSFQTFLLSKLNASIPGALSARYLHISFFSGEVRAAHLSLRDSLNQKIIGLDSIYLKVSLGELFHKKVLVKNFQMLGVEEFLEVKDSNLNLAAALGIKEGGEEEKDSSAESSWNVVIKKARVVNRKFNYFHYEDSTEIDIRGLSLNLSGDIKAKTGRLSLNLQWVKWNQSEKKINIDSLLLNVEALPGENLELSLLARLCNSDLELRGNAKNFGPDIHWDVKLDYRAVLSNWANNLALGPFEGKTDIHLQSKGNLKNSASKLQLQGLAWKESLHNMEGGLSDLSLGFKGGIQKQSGDVQLTIKDLFFKNKDIMIPGTAGNVEAYIDGKKLPKFAATISNDFFDLAASGKYFGIENAKDLELDVQLKGDLNKFSLAKNQGVGGKIHLKTNILGSPQNPEALIEGTVSQLNMGKLKKVDGVISASLSNKNLNIQKLSLSQQHGKLSLKGTVRGDSAFTAGLLDSNRNLDELEYNLNLRAENFDLQPFMGDSLMQAGALIGNFDLEGKGIELPRLWAKAKGNWEFKNFVYKPKNKKLAARGDVSLRLQDNKLNWESLNINFSEGRIHSSGKLNLKDSLINAKLEFENLKLQELSKWAGQGENFSGTVNTGATLKGGILNPNVSLNLKLTEAYAKEKGPISVDVRVDVDSNGYGEIISGDFKLGQSSVNIVSDVQLYTVNLLDIKKYFPNVLNLNLTGSLNAEDIDSLSKGLVKIDFKGSGSWPQFFGKGLIASNGFDIHGQTISAVYIPVKIDEDSILLSGTHFDFPHNNSIGIDGWVRPGEDFDISILSTGFLLSNIHWLDSLHAPNAKLDLDLKGSGRLEKPVLDVNLLLSGLSYQNVPIKDLMFDVQYMDKKILGKFSNLIEGDVNWDQNSGDIQSNLNFGKIELSPFLEMAGIANWTGRVAGTLDYIGNSNRFLNGSGKLVIEELNLKKDNQPLLSAKSQKVELEAGNLQARDFNISLGKSGLLNINGNGSFQNNFKAHVSGEIYIEDFQPLFPEDLDMSGKLQLGGQFSLIDKVPDYKANIDFYSVKYSPPLFEHQLEVTKAALFVNPLLLRLDSLTAFWDKGLININGEAKHKNFNPREYQLHIKGDRVPLNIPNILDLVFDLNANLKGDSLGGLVSGELSVLDGLYYQNVRLTNFLGSDNSRAPPPEMPDTSASGLERNIKLDVAVNSRRPLVVDNNLAYMELIPDVKIKGNLMSPVVIGRAQGKEGVIKWKNRDFKITKAVIDFLNPYQTEASLNISSQIAVRDWLIELGISGKAPDNLNLSLSEKNGNPPLEKADILTVLATNKTSAELLGKSGTGPVSKEALLLSYMANALSKPLKENTSLDVLEIEAGRNKSGEQSDKISLKLGKNLTRRLTTFYTVETDKGKVVQRGSAEYKLWESYLLEGFQDTEDVYGGAVQWGIKWR